MNKKAMPIGKFKASIQALVLFVLVFVPLIYPIGKSEGFNQGVQIAGNVKANTFPVQANDHPRLQARPVIFCPPGYCPVFIGGRWYCVRC